MTAQAAILYSNATTSARHAPSLNAAFAELFAASGIKPQVLNAAESQAAGFGYISGGSRDLAQSQAAGSGTASDHYENNPAGHAAVDINNQRDLRNKLGDALFESILAKHGWHNIQINGAPFPTEPWHFANQDAVPQTAGSDTSPFDNTPDLKEEEDSMKPLLYKNRFGLFVVYPGAPVAGRISARMYDATGTGDFDYFAFTIGLHPTGSGYAATLPDSAPSVGDARWMIHDLNGMAPSYPLAPACPYYGPDVTAAQARDLEKLARAQRTPAKA